MVKKNIKKDLPEDFENESYGGKMDNPDVKEVEKDIPEEKIVTEIDVTDLIEWEKPSGIIIKTNSEKATIEAAVNLCWKRIDKK